jgi:ADP-heptose:LPS heptosyltransferase
MKTPVFYTTTPSIGDLICATPTIKKIAKTYKSKVVVVSPSPWILKNNPFVSQSIHINDVLLSDLERDYDVHKSFHLLGKRDPLGIEFKHAICDIRQFHSKDLGFMLTPEELSCDYFPDPFDSCMSGIDLPENYVVIHPVQSWESRTWEESKWRDLCNRLAESNIPVVAVGKNSGEYSDHLQQDKPVFEIDSVIDYTNKTSLDQTWHILNGARCVITMDSGILHLAGTTDTSIIQIGSSIHPYFRAPYRHSSQSYKYSYVSGSCKIHCASNLEYSLRDWGNIQSVTLIHTCLENKPSFECKPSSESVFLDVIKNWESENLTTHETKFFESENLDIAEEILSIDNFVESFEIPEVLVSFRNGPSVEINGNALDPRLFKVLFYDCDSNELIFESSIRVNHWTKASRKYFTNWRVEVWLGEDMIHESKIDLENKDVCLLFTTSTLGDTISWVAYAEEFRKNHKCKITLQCSNPKIFKDSYPDIDFVKIDTYDMEDKKWYASFSVVYGVQIEDQKTKAQRLQKNYISKKGPLYLDNFNLHDEFKNPRHPHSIPLASICTDALGLEEKEIRTRIKNPNPSERPIKEKYICISEFASSDGLKQWNNKIGWEKLVQNLQMSGYKIVSISKEKSSLKNITKRNGDIDLEERIWYLHHCEFFIGVSSGLSWLAWACGKRVVMISGATMEFNEFKEDNIRIINKEACHGCWNSPEHMDKFACYHASLCPENKGFECTRKISPGYVFERIQEEGLI